MKIYQDRLGKKSAEAQSLGSSITSFLQMTVGNEQSIYILRENELVLGFIKVGYKVKSQESYFYD